MRKLPFSIPEVQKSAIGVRRSAMTEKHAKSPRIGLELHHQLWRSEDPLVHFLRQVQGWMDDILEWQLYKPPPISEFDKYPYGTSPNFGVVTFANLGMACHVGWKTLH